jgi:hypothetical protein
MEIKWTKIFATTDLQKSELLKALLEENEIHCLSINKQDSAYPVFGEIELYVSSADIIKALKVINEQ